MAKKKKYSINVENDEVVSVEVDGARYADPNDIPDLKDRARIQALMSRSLDLQPVDDSWMHKILFPLFIGIGALMLLIAAVSAFFTIRNLTREETAPGVVVDQGIRRNSEGDSYSYPLVEVYVPGHPPQTIELPYGTWPPAYEEGEEVTVMYIPDQPGHFRIRSFSSTVNLWMLAMITGVVGLGFVGITLFVRWALITDFGTRPSASKTQP